MTNPRRDYYSTDNIRERCGLHIPSLSPIPTATPDYFTCLQPSPDDRQQIEKNNIYKETVHLAY